MNIINKISDINVTKKRVDKNGISWVPDIVVCHMTQGSYEGAVSWLSNPKSSVSSHFVVSKKGEVTQLVDIRDTAWCNGTSYSPKLTEKSTSNIVKSRNTNANLYSITIEYEGVYSESGGAITKEQENITISLIEHIANEIKKIYGKDFVFDREHIIGHSEISPNKKPNCPGEKFPFNSIIVSLNKDNDEKGDNEMVSKTDILIDGKKYSVNRILKDGKNYVELRAFEQAGYKIGYKKEEMLPTFTK